MILVKFGKTKKFGTRRRTTAVGYQLPNGHCDERFVCIFLKNERFDQLLPALHGHHDWDFLNMAINSTPYWFSFRRSRTRRLSRAETPFRAETLKMF